MPFQDPIINKTYRGVGVTFTRLPVDAGQLYTFGYIVNGGTPVVLASKIKLPVVIGQEGVSEWEGFCPRTTADNDQIQPFVRQLAANGTTVIEEQAFGPYQASDLIELLDAALLGAMVEAANGLGWTAQQKSAAAAMLRRAAVIVRNNRIAAEAAALLAAKDAKDAEAISI